ncbi:MAG: alpha/beta hydrolase [Bacteroidales bacterium]
MKYLILILSLFACQLYAQEFVIDSAFLKKNFPNGMVYDADIVYKKVNNQDLKLDIYRAPVKNKEFPVVISIHGGAWLSGNKMQDVFFSAKLIRKLIETGYSIVSIDYRLSQEAKFPSQIQDCNDAIDFIFKNAKKYSLDVSNIAVMGGSAGGHLAQLVGTSNEHNISQFYSNGKKPNFKIKAVVSFFGISDFIAMRGNSGMVDHDDPNSAEAQLLGYPPLVRPDLAKLASPTTYITKNTPPVLIFHGDKDPVVQYSQSVLLHSYLDLASVYNKFITVSGAGHGGKEFGADEYDIEILNFLDTYLKTK